MNGLQSSQWRLLGQQIIIRKVPRPIRHGDAHSQILVDDSHCSGLRAVGSVLGLPATRQQWIRPGDSVQTGLESVSQVAADQAAQNCTVLLGEPRITISSSPAPLLSRLVTDAHGFHCVPLPDRCRSCHVAGMRTDPCTPPYGNRSA